MTQFVLAGDTLVCRCVWKAEVVIESDDWAPAKAVQFSLEGHTLIADCVYLTFFALFDRTSHTVVGALLLIYKIVSVAYGRAFTVREEPVVTFALITVELGGRTTDLTFVIITRSTGVVGEILIDC